MGENKKNAHGPARSMVIIIGFYTLFVKVTHRSGRTPCDGDGSWLLAALLADRAWPMATAWELWVGLSESKRARLTVRLIARA